MVGKCYKWRCLEGTNRRKLTMTNNNWYFTRRIEQVQNRIVMCRWKKKERKKNIDTLPTLRRCFFLLFVKVIVNNRMGMWMTQSGTLNNRMTSSFTVSLKEREKKKRKRNRTRIESVHDFSHRHFLLIHCLLKMTNTFESQIICLVSFFLIPSFRCYQILKSQRQIDENHQMSQLTIMHIDEIIERVSVVTYCLSHVFWMNVNSPRSFSWSSFLDFFRSSLQRLSVCRSFILLS